ncbi:MAG: hypothetical protein IJH47_00035 [Oscillospiraceae bacterium]|nr:hypothetical protein [Oscillospiraceae bacterium]
MTFLRAWILGLTGASILAALAGQLTPEGPVKKVTGLVCGVMLAGVMLSPLVRADREILSDALSDYRQTAEELTADVEARENRLIRTFIQEQCRAYILDEAQLLGITDLSCTVRVKWRDESWVPYEVSLITDASAEERRRLGDYLDGELGIPEERQHWNEK